MESRLMEKLITLPNINQSKFRIEPQKQIRSRRFDTKTFFITLLRLAAGNNNDGFLIALTNTFAVDLGQTPPVKSSLCEFRQKINASYFKECLKRLLAAANSHRAVFHGMHIYAIDGQQLLLPRTNDIVKHRFHGRSVSKYRETYFPKGFLTHAYDVLTGITKWLTFNPLLNEHKDALNLLRHFEKKSLILYDRLYFSKALIEAHFKKDLFFLMRCRSNANKKVASFLAGKKKRTYYLYKGRRVYLYKVYNKGEKKYDVYATNLPRHVLKKTTIRRLYELRWEVEVSFRELTDITRGEQWHSKSYNGILQELYMKFWLLNFTKINMRIAGHKPMSPQKRSYKKANFKLIYEFVNRVIYWLWNKIQYLTAYIKPLLRISTEARKRCSRSYPREIKSPRSPYKYNTTGWVWDL